MPVELWLTLRYPFEGDPRGWKKILVGTFVLLVPFLNICALGYFFKWMRDVINDRLSGLPHWESWGQLFIDGLKFLVVVLIYLILPVLLSFAGLLPMFLGILRGILRGEWEIVLAAIMGGAFLSIAFFIFCFFLTLFAWFFIPMALLRLVESGELSFSLSLKEVYYDIKDNLFNYSLVHLAVIGLFIIASIFFGIFVLILLIIPFAAKILPLCSAVFWSGVVFYICIVGGKLFGDVYLNYLYEKTFGRTFGEVGK